MEKEFKEINEDDGFIITSKYKPEYVFKFVKKFQPEIDEATNFEILMLILTAFSGYVLSFLASFNIYVHLFVIFLSVGLNIYTYIVVGKKDHLPQKQIIFSSMIILCIFLMFSGKSFESISILLSSAIVLIMFNFTIAVLYYNIFMKKMKKKFYSSQSNLNRKTQKVIYLSIPNTIFVLSLCSVIILASFNTYVYIFLLIFIVGLNSYTYKVIEKKDHLPFRQYFVSSVLIWLSVLLLPIVESDDMPLIYVIIFISTTIIAIVYYSIFMKKLKKKFIQTRKGNFENKQKKIS